MYHTVMATTLYSIGHSNRSLDEFISLLQAHNIATLIDIRSRPQSRRHPHFAMDQLRAALEQAGITYHWAGRQLGGLRKTVANSHHTALDNEGMRGYADHMESEEFHRGANQLIHLAQQAPTAMMCAEKLPEHCHRSLLSDYLVLQGVEVRHIIDEKETREHHLSPYARRESAQLVYDRNTTASLL
jgi:uncharacterized protein (DUF488 family)